MNNYTYIDLFSGAGGLGEGFEQSGFYMIRSIDSDRHACQTLKTRELYRIFANNKELILQFKFYVEGKISLNHLYNIHPGLKSYIDKKIKCKSLSIENIYSEVNSVKKLINSELDVLIGGPPCQAYSLIGRARDKENKNNDERHELYIVYLRLVSLLKPKFFVYENVPGLLSACNVNGQILHRFSEDFSKLRTSYTIIPKRTDETEKFPLNKLHFKDYIICADNYGVPQFRKRVVLVGVRTDFYMENKDLINKFWIRLDNKKTQKPVSVQNAIYDLPHVEKGEGSDQYYSHKYEIGRPSKYQDMMRKNTLGIINHKARTHMESDVERYKYFIKKSLESKRHISLKEIQNEKPELMPNHKNKKNFFG